jgi:D-alanyl-lipoteichoic acid acyltransferase DltB (MBOAT superfamily)
MLNYLVWCAYHGVLLTVYHAVRVYVPKAVAGSAIYNCSAARLAGTAITFGLVSVGWVPFMTDLPHAWRLLRLMFVGA